MQMGYVVRDSKYPAKVGVATFSQSNRCRDFNILKREVGHIGNGCLHVVLGHVDFPSHTFSTGSPAKYISVPEVEI